MPQPIAPYSMTLPMLFNAGHAADALSRHPRCSCRGDFDQRFIAMLDGYRASGGLAREHEVLALSKCRGGPDAATLAHWVALRKVISFEWQSQTWLPLFQFTRLDMQPQVELARVLAELTPVCDAWELATWFAQPNPWLADRTPVDTMATDLPALLNAARAERFVANG